MTNSTTISSSLEPLSKHIFPEVARGLRKHADRIVQFWLVEVRKDLPSAEELTLNQLRDHVPMMIEQMAVALAGEQLVVPDKASEPHSEIRFHQAYNVDELLIEYHLLRIIIFQELSSYLARALTVLETVAISVVLDTLQRHGVVAFVNHLTGQLRASDELQANYISHLNHDLRGGMNGILLMVEVLKRELSGEPRFSETTEDLDAMRRSVLDSVFTMDRFVFAHRLGRGKQQVRFGQVSVKPLINEVTNSFIYSARERNISVDVDIADGCAIQTDRDLLRLILQNVVGNAIRHSRREGGRVQVLAKSSPEVCVITVIDDGPGIAETLMKDLFGSPSSPGKTKSTFKLGLPVSKMAADIIGATIVIQSVQGSGTTVTITVPDHGVANSDNA